MQIILASNNHGKLKEIQHYLAKFNLTLHPQSDYKIPEIAETGLTFVENAILKARHAAKLSGLPALADDSGIEVDALAGAPGIYSARYAGEKATDRDNLEKLLSVMRDYKLISERTARYQCVLVYMRHAHDPTPWICQGTWEGYLLQQPQGDQGFGYDPIFYVPAQQCSAAELPLAVKNKISHRAQALAQLVHKFSELSKSDHK